MLDSTFTLTVKQALSMGSLELIVFHNMNDKDYVNHFDALTLISLIKNQFPHITFEMMQ